MGCYFGMCLVLILVWLAGCVVFGFSMFVGLWLWYCMLLVEFGFIDCMLLMWG